MLQSMRWQRLRHDWVTEQQQQLFINELSLVLEPIFLLAQSLSCVWLFVILWTVAHQAPLSMGFPRQEYWSGLPVASPEDFPDPGIELYFLHFLQWQVNSLPLAPPRKPHVSSLEWEKKYCPFRIIKFISDLTSSLCWNPMDRGAWLTPWLQKKVQSTDSLILVLPPNSPWLPLTSRWGVLHLSWPLMAASVVNTLVLAGAAYELVWSDLDSNCLLMLLYSLGLVQSSSQMLALDCPTATSAIILHHDSWDKGEEIQLGSIHTARATWVVLWMNSMNGLWEDFVSLWC